MRITQNGDEQDEQAYEAQRQPFGNPFHGDDAFVILGNRPEAVDYIPGGDDMGYAPDDEYSGADVEQDVVQHNHSFPEVFE